MLGNFLQRNLRPLFKRIPLSLREKIADLIALDESYSDFFSRASYNSDGLLTFHNADCLSSPEFLNAYLVGENTGSWKGSDIRWRASVCCWAAQNCLNLDGDYVECGVNKGGMALTTIEYTNFSSSDKKYYLYDTFDGLHQDLLTEEEVQIGIQAGRYEPCYEQVQDTFKQYSNVIIVKGEVPSTLYQVSPKKVAYLAIDMNCVLPEIEALRFFWDKLVPGAIILLDDYGWKNHYLQKKAFDEFALLYDIPILQLPTGQGLLIKPAT